MKRGKLLLFTGSMMKQSENMEMQILGNIALKCLTIWELELLLKARFSVSMEDSHQTLKPLIR